MRFKFNKLRLKGRKKSERKKKSRTGICSASTKIHSDGESKEALSELRGKELTD